MKNFRNEVGRELAERVADFKKRVFEDMYRYYGVRWRKKFDEELVVGGIYRTRNGLEVSIKMKGMWDEDPLGDYPFLGTVLNTSEYHYRYVFFTLNGRNSKSLNPCQHDIVERIS